MRPEILYSLFSPVTALKGVGPKVREALEKIGIEHRSDLLWHLPTGLIDRRFSPKIKDAPDGTICTLTVTVDEHIKPHSRRQPFRVRCSDETGSIELVFFRGQPDWFKKNLPEGEERVISGRVEYFNGRPQMAHPDHIGPVAERDQIMRVEPIYSLTAGLTQKQMQKMAGQALQDLPELPEWQDQAFLAANKWPSWKAAVQKAHAPEGSKDILAGNPARSRLAYDELLANQLALALVRNRLRGQRGQALQPTNDLQEKVRAALPFDLTADQARTLAEIRGDLESPQRMMRLVQGDVGSGKTAVALLAMLMAVESGGQACIMAPTEILARQHDAGLAPLLQAAGVESVLLTGRDKGDTRAMKLDALKSGRAKIAIGTHALFQDDVAFDDLRLAVIDEQHRFGVHQRLQLSGKSDAPVDLLVMTATPIPRTLALTAYGDLDVSQIKEKPPGRQPIDTIALPEDRIADLVTRIEAAIKNGDRAYWVCPLVEESDVLDITAAEQRFKALQTRLGAQVGLVHGRMKAADKDKVMSDFAEGRISVLVATTVIEVGVNVPEATIMVIEHAERFGLSQLHQLRGRVGRGDKRSSCILLYNTPLGETAKARIAIMRETEDGFRIAEEDLRLRGAGDVLGTKQSGMPQFLIADLDAHAELLAAARDDVLLILNRDPDLKSDRGKALTVLLYLFERDQAVRYWRSG